MFLLGEIVDGSCAGCLTAADARLSGVHCVCPQEIALVDDGAVIPYNAADCFTFGATDVAAVVAACDTAGVDVTPNNAAECAVNIFAEFSSVVAICDAAVVGVAPNDAAKDALNGKRFIVASDVTGAVAVCDAAVVSVVPNNTAEIAVKKTLGWGSV